MRFELDELVIEDSCRDSLIAQRVLSRIDVGTKVRHAADVRPYVRPLPNVSDAFGAGKRRMVVTRRQGRFLMACPASGSGFACCGYMVLALASNCPMDCSYCFLQDYLADNPSFQIYANYSDCFDELEQLARRGAGRSFRIGTGEFADSLAFDYLTGIASDLVEFFARQRNLTLELKTKTDDINGLLAVDPRGRTIVAWTLSPEVVFRNSEHRTASPVRRIAAARRVLDAGYRLAFHLDPIIAFPGAEAAYNELMDNLFSLVPAERITFFSLGGLRMTPSLRHRARTRFSADPMLVGEEVLGPDGRFRAAAPMRIALYRHLKDRLSKAGVGSVYLCMEQPSVHEKIFGTPPPSPGQLGERLAGECV
jgi:spore photoproduct lyase